MLFLAVLIEREQAKGKRKSRMEKNLTGFSLNSFKSKPANPKPGGQDKQRVYELQCETSMHWTCSGPSD